MLLFRKMLHCKEGSWLACVSAEKIDRSPIVLGASGASAFPHTVLVSSARNENARSRDTPDSNCVSGSGSDLELAIGIARGLIASGISRTKLTCGSPLSSRAPSASKCSASW